jgi:hypothetical protein
MLFDELRLSHILWSFGIFYILSFCKFYGHLVMLW